MPYEENTEEYTLIAILPDGRDTPIARMPRKLTQDERKHYDFHRLSETTFADTTGPVADPMALASINEAFERKYGCRTCAHLLLHRWRSNDHEFSCPTPEVLGSTALTNYLDYAEGTIKCALIAMLISDCKRRQLQPSGSPAESASILLQNFNLSSIEKNSVFKLYRTCFEDASRDLIANHYSIEVISSLHRNQCMEKAASILKIALYAGHRMPDWRLNKDRMIRETYILHRRVACLAGLDINGTCWMNPFDYRRVPASLNRCKGYASSLREILEFYQASDMRYLAINTLSEYLVPNIDGIEGPGFMLHIQVDGTFAKNTNFVVFINKYHFYTIPYSAQEINNIVKLESMNGNDMKQYTGEENLPWCFEDIQHQLVAGWLISRKN